jgi:hypothetical protein
MPTPPLPVRADLNAATLADLKTAYRLLRPHVPAVVFEPLKQLTDEARVRATVAAGRFSVLADIVEELQRREPNIDLNEIARGSA